MGEEAKLIWKPETSRINRVVVKNARGHALFEYAAPITAEPNHVCAVPLESLSRTGRVAFEDLRGDQTVADWPEVGSRMMTCVMTGQDMRNGW